MQPINWCLVWNNPLDYLHGRTQHELVTPAGEPVRITQSGTDFVVTIGDRRIVTGGNACTCYVLNQRGVGVKG